MKNNSSIMPTDTMKAIIDASIQKRSARPWHRKKENKVQVDLIHVDHKTGRVGGKLYIDGKYENLGRSLRRKLTEQLTDDQRPQLPPSKAGRFTAFCRGSFGVTKDATKEMLRSLSCMTPHTAPVSRPPLVSAPSDKMYEKPRAGNPLLRDTSFAKKWAEDTDASLGLIYKKAVEGGSAIDALQSGVASSSQPESSSAVRYMHVAPISIGSAAPRSDDSASSAPYTPSSASSLNSRSSSFYGAEESSSSLTSMSAASTDRETNSLRPSEQNNIGMLEHGITGRPQIGTAEVNAAEDPYVVPPKSALRYLTPHEKAVYDLAKLGLPVDLTPVEPLQWIKGNDADLTPMPPVKNS